MNMNNPDGGILLAAALKDGASMVHIIALSIR